MGVGSRLSQCRFWGPNSGVRVGTVSLPVEPSYDLSRVLLNSVTRRTAIKCHKLNWGLFWVMLRPLPLASPCSSDLVSVLVIVPAHTQTKCSGFSSGNRGNGLHAGQMEPRMPELPARSSLSSVESESWLNMELMCLLISF